MAKSEFYSPLSCIRNLKTVNIKNPYVILQLKERDYESCAKQLCFKKVLFSKIAAIKFSKNLSKVEYKINFIDENYTKGSLRNDIVLGLRAAYNNSQNVTNNCSKKKVRKTEKKFEISRKKSNQSLVESTPREEFYISRDESCHTENDFILYARYRPAIFYWFIKYT